MALFSQEGNTAESILNAQPVGGSVTVRGTAAPFVPGIASDYLAAPSDVNPLACMMKGGKLLQLCNYGDFQGAPTTGGGTPLPYVLSDVCSQGKWRLVISASIASLFATGGCSPELWLIPPGPLPTKTDGTDPFFLNSGGLPNKNAPPLARGIRVDTQQGIASLGLNSPGESLVMIAPAGYILVPPGWCLMGYCGLTANNPNLGASLRLQIMYAEFPTSTDVEY